MNCLEYETLMAATYKAPAALACCVYCGAGICLDHARLVVLSAQPAGLVPRRGARRIVCAALLHRPCRRRRCAAYAATVDHASQARTVQ